MADLPLSKLEETATTITLGWTPPAGAIGYRLTREKAAGKYSHSWDGAKSEARFSKDSAWDCTFVVWGERLMFAAQSQVAGNVLQWWGGDLGNCRVPFVVGRDIQGRVVETDGTGGADAPIVHEFGRGERVCLNPRLSNVAFASKPNFVYKDCTATYQ